MLRTNRICFSLFLFFLLAFNGPAWAMTLTASPNPAVMNKTVTFKIGISIPSGSCNIFIVYGDSPDPVSIGSVSGNMTLTTTHTYPRAGHYTVNAYADSPTVVKPNPVYLSLQVSDFDIKRIETKFENNRPEITIKRKEPVPQLYTKINFSGSGLLKGYWEVDGNQRHHFFKQLSIGPEAVFKYPEVPSLPSFTPGSHIVRFVITQPALDIDFPKAVYYVTAEDYIPVSRIKFLVPEKDNIVLDSNPIVFKWQTASAATLYLVHVFTEKQEIPIFSAYSKQGSYNLRPDILASRLAPGIQYYIQVVGFNANAQVVTQSEKTALTFKQ